MQCFSDVSNYDKSSLSHSTIIWNPDIFRYIFFTILSTDKNDLYSLSRSCDYEQYYSSPNLFLCYIIISYTLTFQIRRISSLSNSPAQSSVFDLIFLILSFWWFHFFECWNLPTSFKSPSQLFQCTYHGNAQIWSSFSITSLVNSHMLTFI